MIRSPATPTTDTTASFAVATPAGSFAGRALMLPASDRGPWAYMVSPSQLECRGRRIVPKLAKAWFDDGFSTNERGNLGRGMRSDLERAGWIQIPHDRPVVAFDELITTPAPSTYLKQWRGISAAGKPATVWTDAWRRPEMLGAEIEWVQDDAGRDEWLAGCIDIFAPDGLTDRQIEIAIRPLVRLCRQLSDRQDPRGRRYLRTAFASLPVEHVPVDLVDVYEELTGAPVSAEVPAPVSTAAQPKKTRTAKAAEPTQMTAE